MAAFSRSINIEMDWLSESSIEIRGTLDDNVHSLAARIVVSYPDFVIREASSQITRMPYTGFCTGAMGAISGLIGERVGRGFRKRATEILGGSESCNHLHTLVFNMGSSAFQMNYVAIKRGPEAASAIRATENDPALRRLMVLGWMPQLRNSCYLFSESSDALFESKKEE